jgi:hypothetical protein
VGRLDEIIERNRNPGRGRRKRALSVGFGSVVLLIVLLLLIFTDLAQPPDDERLQPKPDTGEHRVRDILLRPAPTTNTTR